MALALFLGHGNIQMRGGAVIFNSIYDEWPTSKNMIFRKTFLDFSASSIKYLFKNKVDYIVVEHEYFTEAIIAIIGKIINRKARLYGPVYHMPPFPGIKHNFMPKLIHYIDYRLGVFFMNIFYSGIYTENSFVQKELKSFNGKTKIILESPGIPEIYIKETNEIENLEKSIDFLFLAAFTENKGVYDFLHVMKKLKNNNYSFAMAGFADKETIDKIKDYIDMEGIKNVSLYINIDDKKKYELYSKSKVYVLPSIEDGIPITFYEAWAYGDLIVTYNLDTYTDIQQYIIPVKIHDKDSLAESMENTIKSYDKLKGIFFEKNYDYSKMHSYEMVIKKMVKQLL